MFVGAYTCFDKKTGLCRTVMTGIGIWSFESEGCRAPRA